MALRELLVSPFCAGKNHKHGGLKNLKGSGTLHCDVMKQANIEQMNTRDVRCLRGNNNLVGRKAGGDLIHTHSSGGLSSQTASCSSITDVLSTKSELEYKSVNVSSEETAVCDAQTNFATVRAQGRHPSSVRCSETCVSYYVFDPNCNIETNRSTTTHAKLESSLVEYCSCKIQGHILMNFIAPEQVAVAVHKNFFKGELEWPSGIIACREMK